MEPSGPEIRQFTFDRRAVDEYVYFGFVPRPHPVDPLFLLSEWTRREPRSTRSRSEPDLVRRGVRALKDSVLETVERSGSRGEQVVLLSGGLDSRAILGGLLELFDTSQLLAATFGAPGEQDYDFAAQVAEAAGVRHEVLDARSVEWSTPALVESVRARQVPLPFPFGQRYLSYCLYRRIGPAVPYWDGLGGGSASGAVLPLQGAARDWRAALEVWVTRHRVRRAEALVGPGFDPFAPLPAAPLLPEEVLSYPDQLDFALRQARYIVTRRMRGYEVLTPYLSGAWLDFMLSLPLELRRDQYLYLRILAEAYPRLSSLPTTALRGASLTAPRWRTARQDAARAVLRRSGRFRRRLTPLLLPRQAAGANFTLRRAIREDPVIRDLVAENVSDLQHRRLFESDVWSLWKRHVSGEQNDQALLAVLLGLELNLKAIEVDGRDAVR